jgi:L-iditol 2-dehydrogenase
MKALLLTAPSRLEYTEFPTPELRDDEVLLRIRACGICGSDIHGWDGSSGRRHPPLIMGHEAAGEIAAVGRFVSGWHAGDRVTFDSTIYCGQCEFCRAGQVNLCEDRRVVGVSPAEYKQHGAFAEFLALPPRILHRVPDGLSFAHAAFVEPTSIALHAVRRAAPQPDDTAVVVGSGMIGLLVIQALRASGVERVIAVDREAVRLALAKELGATDTLQVGDIDVVAAVLDLTGGHGADIAMEVVGIAPTVQLSLQVARRGGRVVLVGNLAPHVEFPLQIAVTRELDILGSCGSAGEYPESLRLIAEGRIRVEPLISAQAPLSDGAAWFQKLSARDGARFMKVILQP